MLLLFAVLGSLAAAPHEAEAQCFSLRGMDTMQQITLFREKGIPAAAYTVDESVELNVGKHTATVRDQAGNTFYTLRYTSSNAVVYTQFLYTMLITQKLQGQSFFPYTVTCFAGNGYRYIVLKQAGEPPLLTFGRRRWNPTQVQQLYLNVVKVCRVLESMGGTLLADSTIESLPTKVPQPYLNQLFALTPSTRLQLLPAALAFVCPLDHPCYLSSFGPLGTYLRTRGRLPITRNRHSQPFVVATAHESWSAFLALSMLSDDSVSTLRDSAKDWTNYMRFKPQLTLLVSRMGFPAGLGYSLNDVKEYVSSWGKTGKLAADYAQAHPLRQLEPQEQISSFTSDLRVGSSNNREKSANISSLMSNLRVEERSQNREKSDNISSLVSNLRVERSKSRENSNSAQRHVTFLDSITVPTMPRTASQLAKSSNEIVKKTYKSSRTHVKNGHTKKHNRAAKKKNPKIIITDRIEESLVEVSSRPRTS